MVEVLDQKYLPFSEDKLVNHFAKVRDGGECVTNKKHLDYYRNSVKRYHDYLDQPPGMRGRSLSEMKGPCQIEKDERFWIASCMMVVFYAEQRQRILEELLVRAFGDASPIKGLESWKECLEGHLDLFFEAKLPSPGSYKKWLREHMKERQFIPHLRSSAGQDKDNLEGPTNVDAILMNPESGFAILIEAKVLSDISCLITYDAARNQIARTIDVMLEENRNLCEPLNHRDPERTLFLLITPEMFKTSPADRLYGYKFLEYREKPDALARDLPHRHVGHWREVTCKLGWLTWEDFHRAHNECCPWL